MPLLFQLRDLSLNFPHKSCFENFSTNIYSENRIALTGNNGAGKSMLLKILAGLDHPSSGTVTKIGHIQIGYIPQTIVSHNDLSGGERFNKALSQELAKQPDLLLLDEPTNHLDRKNRTSLIRMLQRYTGAVIAATHDEEFIRACADTIWHINQGKISVFTGDYDSYLAESAIKTQSILDEVNQLNNEKKNAHIALMKEQTRAKNSRMSGEKKLDNKRILKVKANQMRSDAEKKTGKRKEQLNEKRAALVTQLKNINKPEIVHLKFHLPHNSKTGGTLLHISGGSAGYGQNNIISDINLILNAGDRLAIRGDNGSGKSTLVKAILSDSEVVTGGEWYLPPPEQCGYLDQHYSGLDPDKTVYEMARDKAPHMPEADLRSHLNDFLFKKNEEISNKISNLSGGEKARLSLALIALKTPSLLVLDEITNNVDLITKRYLSQIISRYPGTLIVISHEVSFLDEINITKCYDILK